MVKVSIKGQTAPGSLAESVRHVKVKLVTISGKGGVGKSLVTTSIAVGLAMRGYKVGILDGDVYGPTVPKMLGLTQSVMYADEKSGKITPVTGPLGIEVVSIDFALPSDDTAVIWRAPLVNQALRDFISQVEWGPLDVLIVDLPPGTGDAPLTIAQSLQGGLDGSIIVTIPTDISRRIVLKSIDFSRRLNIRVAGVVENMCCFKCPDSGTTHYIFGRGVGEKIAEAAGVPFLGGIPIDPEFSQHLDAGKLHEFLQRENETSKSILAIVDKLVEFYRERLTQTPPAPQRRVSLMKLPGDEEES